MYYPSKKLNKLISNGFEGQRKIGKSLYTLKRVKDKRTGITYTNVKCEPLEYYISKGSSQRRRKNKIAELKGKSTNWQYLSKLYNR
jgi:hypothetical protein